MQVTKTGNSITLDFTDDEIFALADSLLDPLGHFEQVAREKVANCQDRLFDVWMKKLAAEKRVNSIPTDEAALLGLIKLQPDYQSRSEREQANLLE